MFAFLRLIRPHLRPYRGAYLVGLFVVIAVSALRMTVPELMGAAVDEVQRLSSSFDDPAERWQRAFFPTLAWLIPVLSLIFGAGMFLQRLTIIQSSRDVEYAVRRALYEKLSRQSHEYFNHQQTGELMARCSADVEVIRMAVGPAVMYLGQAVTLTPLVLLLEWRISPALTLVSFLPMALIGVVVFVGAKAQYRYTLRIQEELAALSARARENFAGVRVIKSFAREESEIARFTLLSHSYQRAQIGFALVRTVQWALITALGESAVLIIVAVAATGWLAETISLGDLTRFLAYQAILMWPMIALGWVMNLFARGQAGMERIREVLEAPVAVADPAASATVEAITGALDFHGVTFRYHPELPPVLREVTLSAPAGTTLGIVGPVGSGKSTLVSLLPRLYDVLEGQVLIDGRPVARYPLATLRGAIGWVGQDAFLFADRVRRNIGFHERDVAMTLVESAARQASIHNEVAAFPEQYETLLGERGLTVSGGQKQRLTIARALARRARILILDDCLSAVDNRTARAFLREVAHLRQGRTTIIVSHRMDLVREADTIVVLDQGRIAAQGTHQDLMALPGYYANMTRYQEMIGRSYAEATSEREELLNPAT